ncbi:hypothetical protein SLE2022_199240 [Rubroshorea leprosula]
MQHDEVIWQIIRHNHCSFMSKINSGIFCRNPYNITGICNRSSCPLANSRYATIRDHNGVFYLYMKTIERAHQPKVLWETVKLPEQYEKALEIIGKHMVYWPELLVNKIQQRLKKMSQTRTRMKKLALKTREKIMTTPRKEKKREARREKKAEEAALLEKSIEKELLTRLGQGDIYNYPFEIYKKILDGEQADSEKEFAEAPEMEYVEAYDELDDLDDIEDFGGFPMDKAQKRKDNVAAADVDRKEDTDEGRGVRKGSSSACERLGKDKSSLKLKKRARVLVEVEHEDAPGRQKATL